MEKEAWNSASMSAHYGWGKYEEVDSLRNKLHEAAVQTGTWTKRAREEK